MLTEDVSPAQRPPVEPIGLPQADGCVADLDRSVDEAVKADGESLPPLLEVPPPSVESVDADAEAKLGVPAEDASLAPLPPAGAMVADVVGPIDLPQAERRCANFDRFVDEAVKADCENLPPLLEMPPPSVRSVDADAESR